MEYNAIQEAFEKMQKKLPGHFGDTFYELRDYKRQKGVIKFTVQGFYDRPYIFDVDLTVIKKLFMWLEDILDLPYSTNHHFQFFDIKKKRHLSIGYLPISSH